MMKNRDLCNEIHIDEDIESLNGFDWWLWRVRRRTAKAWSRTRKLKELIEQRYVRRMALGKDIKIVITTKRESRSR
jgi:hypothetical protein